MNEEILDNDDDFDLSAIYGANENIKPVTAPIVERKTVSFQQPITENETPVSKTNKKRFITRTVQIDKFNSQRRRIELTPSVCDVCAFDVAAKPFGDWHKVPSDQRDVITKALVKHKELVHTAADNLIIEEDQMPTKWLGGGKL